MNPKEIGRQLPDAALCAMVEEVLVWRRTGVLEGETLTRLAAQLVRDAGMTERDSLSDAESVVLLEAAARYAGLDVSGTRRTESIEGK